MTLIRLAANFALNGNRGAQFGTYFADVDFTKLSSKYAPFGVPLGCIFLGLRLLGVHFTSDGRGDALDCGNLR